MLLTRCFFLSDTHGLPLSVQVAVARERGWKISLPHFYHDALAAGWTSERALVRIEEALIDAGETREYIEPRLKWLQESTREGLLK